VMVALAGARAPEARGAAIGLVVGAGALGGFALPWLHGALGDLAGPALAALPKPPARFILYFEHDSADLTAESQALLQKVLGTIRDRAPVDVSVVGHTDTVGKKEYNYALSLRRAKTVASFLIKKGVDPSVLHITSHGKDNPLVPTGDQVPEPRNRRVEITVR